MPSVSLQQLSEIAKVINSPMAIDELLAIIMRSASKLIGTETASLLLMDHETNELKFNVVLGQGEKELKELRIPLGKGIAGLTAQQVKPIIVNDAETDPRVLRQADSISGFRTRNLVSVPMLVKDKLVGVLQALNTVGREEFSPQDVSLLRHLADQAAIAIDNRSLIIELERQNRELELQLEEIEFLYKVQDHFSEPNHPDDLFAEGEQVYSELPSVNRVVLFERVGADKLIVVRSWGLDESEKIDSQAAGIFKEVMHIGESRLVQTQKDLPTLAPFELTETKEFLSLPVLIDGGVEGVIHIASSDTNTPLASLRQRLEVSASLFGDALKKLRLQQRLLNEQKILRELETAAQLQQQILPSRFPDHPAFSIAAASIPETGVGGDFYDFLPLEDDKMGFLIADVSGKGIPAGLFMALCRSVIRAEARQTLSPRRVLELANSSVYADSESGMFVTSMYVVADMNNRLLTYSCAGHFEQYLFRHEEQTIETLASSGLPLGAFDENRFEERILMTKPGDVLFLFTDGLLEAFNPEDEMFGEERTQELLKSLHDMHPKDMVSKIIETVREFTAGQPLSDDLTLMVVTFH